MSHMVRRPPATRMGIQPRQVMRLGRGPGPAQSVAIFQRRLRPGDSFQAGNTDLSGGYLITGRLHYDDILQAPPVLEQPKLVFNSVFQPLVRWGFRRSRRTYMRASTPLTGRWVSVGAIINKHFLQPRMTGVTTRQAGGGYAYSYPRLNVEQRLVLLGSPNRSGRAYPTPGAK